MKGSGGEIGGGRTGHGGGEIGGGRAGHGGGEIGGGRAGHGGGEIGGGRTGRSGGEVGGGRTGNAGGEVGGGRSTRAGEIVRGETSGNRAEVAGKAKAAEVGKSSRAGDTVSEINLHHHEVMTQAKLEAVHTEYLEAIMSKESAYINDAGRTRVKETSVRLAKPSEMGTRRGSYNAAENVILIRETADTERMRATTAHETLHSSSNHTEVIVPRPDKNGYEVYRTVGMRKESYFVSNRTGEKTGFEESGRGLNEGFTDLFTEEILAEIDSTAAEAQKAAPSYQIQSELAQELQNLVGEDAVKEAYFGGKPSLKEAVDQYGGDGAYDFIVESFDHTLKTDYVTRMKAAAEIQGVYDRMAEVKSEREKHGK